jgi:hypothetical protein
MSIFKRPFQSRINCCWLAPEKESKSNCGENLVTRRGTVGPQPRADLIHEFRRGKEFAAVRI